ncbi:HYR domain-containing protein [Salinimicrobium catena]|nr:HYR domain-containing protein [Salinimicrobium catena]
MCNVHIMSRWPGNHYNFSCYCQAFRVATIALLINLTFTAVSTAQTSPDYTWVQKADLPTVSGSSLNIEDLTLAVAIDSDQNIYTLSLENGIDKRDPDGNLIQENLISGDLLDSPRDIAVDEDGFIYVADYIASGSTFTDDGKIRVFDAAGNYLPEKTIFTSFYRPLGLDVSGDKVFVAEYYDGEQGPEQGSTFSRVRIYDKNSKAILRETKNVDIPLRIAVNSEGKIYVSQAGSGNTGTLIFDKDLVALGRLPDIISPGSVIVDALDFVHVIEYGSRVNFSEFINFDNLGLVEISSLAKDISDGVKNEEFFVKIFDPNDSFTGIILEQLDFPVDLAQKDCGHLYINNSEIFDGSFWGMYVPSKLEFDLEIYERIPSIDAAEAPHVACPAPILVDLPPGENTAIVTFDAPIATDLCGAQLSQTAGLPSGSNFSVGEHIIEFTAEDATGNTSICRFTIIVLQNEDLEPPQIQCPEDVNLAAGPTECTANAEYDLPKATDDSGQVELTLISGPAIGEAIGVGEFPVIYQAKDAAGNIATCEFAITVGDATAPAIDNCPGDQQEVLASEGFLLTDYTRDLVIEDCSEVRVEQNPAPGTILNESAEISIIAEDEFGNRSTCTFQVILTPEEVLEITTCPGAETLVLEENCSAILPDLRSGVETNIFSEITQEPAPGTVISEETTVRFTATDANADTDFCEITVDVVDRLYPEITCPADKQFSFDPQEGFEVPDFRSEAEATDNCTFELIQDPVPGSTIFSDRMIIITAVDASGNETSCEFALDVTEETPDPVEITSCPSSLVLELSAACTAVLPDLTAEISTSIDAEVVQAPAPGTVISEKTTVRFTATDANGNTDLCEITVSVADKLNPEITCPPDKRFSFDPAEGFEVPDFRSEAEATDNCAFELIQNPVPGSTIFSDRLIIITAVDASGNETSCEFSLDLTEETADPVEITSCPSSLVLELSAACTAVLPDLTAEISTSIDAEVVQEPAPGTVISEKTTVRFTATDANGNTDLCEITVSVADKLSPYLTCPADKQFSFDPQEGFEVPDFRSEAEATDNCAFELIQDPVPGTRIFTDKVIFITAKDAAGNETFCEFALDLTEETANPVEITSCASSQVLELSAACTAVLPDLTPEITTNIDAEITQEPAPGTVISEETTVRFTATDANWNTDLCEITVSVADKLNPDLTCPADKRFSFDPAEGFEVPDFRSEAEATDNCAFELVQDPAPGTRIFTDKVIFITAKDAAGNETFCEFALDLTEQTADPVEITSCASSQVLELSAACTTVLPDLTAEISTSIDAEVVQEPAPGTGISEETTVRFTATDANDNTDFCEITVNVEDNLAPEITCPGDTVMTWNAEEGYVLPDLTGNISVNDCGEVSLLQEPAPGTLLLAEQTITFSATDASGNRAECSFWLHLSAEEILSLSCPDEQLREIGENCGYVMEDFSSVATVNMENAVISQEPAPGTLVYEKTEITLNATAKGQNTSCSFSLDLIDSQPPKAQCVGTFTLTLNEQGTATLSPEQLDNGSKDNCGIISRSLSKTSFSTADVGTQTVTYTVVDTEGNESSCETEITIQAYKEADIICVEEITLQLNAERRAVIDPRSLFSGGTGTVQYSVSKEEFTCADIGSQVVQFSYTTPYDQGNCEIRVTVEDPDRNCELIIDEPEDPGHFVIISPNPGNGLVEIYSSADIEIEQANVFDMRGRFLLARNFSEGSPREKPYSIDLRKYQSGVYTVELETNSGKFIRRAIIKND